MLKFKGDQSTAAKQSVVALLPGGWSGGVESVVTDLFEALSSRFSRPCSIIRFIEKRNKYNCLEESGFCVDPLDQQIYTLKRLSAYIGRIPILMVNGVGLDLSLGWYLRKQGTRIIYVIHGNSDYYFRSALHFKPVVDRFVALTESMAENLCRVTGDIPVHVIPNGVIVPRELVQRSNHHRIRLLYVGRIDNQLKALERSIGLVAGLEYRKIPYFLTFVGDGPYKEELQTRMRHLTSSSQVVFLGQMARADIPQIMAQHDVLVLFSRSEGMSMAVLEGMARGLAPVVTETDGIRCLVKHGHNGMVVPQANLAEMVDYIALLQNDSTLLASVQFNAWETASHQFSLEKTAEEYDKIFSEMENLGSFTGSVPDLFCRRDMIDFRFIPNVFAKRARRFFLGSF